MSSRRLTQRRVDSLKARDKTWDLRDGSFKGFGVRVLPSGRKSYFLHSQIDGCRVWHPLGDADDISLDEAQAKARALLVPFEDDTPEPILFEVVAEEVFQRYGRTWKPGTLAVNRRYLRSTILPWFSGKAIGDVTRQDVQRWFTSLHETPVAADRSAPILSVIFRQAEVYGYRTEGTNPCTGIKRYRRQGRERFLTADEIRRLSEALDRSDELLLSSIVRLLLLTGCRKSEILTLKWKEYREGNLHLCDSKTGPRTVWLSSAARQILDDLPRSGSWAFPSPKGRGHLTPATLRGFWRTVCAEAGLKGVRCHDLRHTFASVALAHGETVLTIGRLLGHNDPATTLKYTHLSDAAVHDAAEALATVLGSKS
ncbi:MAG: tyrosine-type recombinase/integrase [Deltaproteobacteria bacterium]|nr:tyrosine-type recombinase/integrase [Deltaproteobacteria bacterium]